MENRTLALVAGLVALAVLIIGGVSLLGKHQSELHFTLVFKDAKQLRPGQFLVYRGTRIGKVQTVDLDPTGTIRVQIQVTSKYRNLVHQEATFVIEKPAIADISGEHQVTMSDSGSKRTPIVEGSVLQGSEGWLSDLAEKARETLTKATDRLRDAFPSK